MKSTVFIVILSFCFDTCFTENAVQTLEDFEESSRSKRQLLPLGIPIVFTYGATYKLILGMITPVRAKDFINLLFAVNFQYQYAELSNITEVTKNYFSRQQRGVDIDMRKYERMTFYHAVEDLLNIKGFNGPQCLRRAICEAAQYPVEEEALVGEIIHILLTPNYGRSQLEDKDETWDSLMSEYLSAQTAGLQMFHCASIYAGCPEGQGILELISELHDE